MCVCVCVCVFVCVCVCIYMSPDVWYQICRLGCCLQIAVETENEKPPIFTKYKSSSVLESGHVTDADDISQCLSCRVTWHVGTPVLADI